MSQPKKSLRPKKSSRLQWKLSGKIQHVDALCGLSIQGIFRTLKIFIIIKERKWIVNGI